MATVTVGVVTPLGTIRLALAPATSCNRHPILRSISGQGAAGPL